VASLSRSRTPDDPDLIDARRGLQAARIADEIAAVARRIADAAPPLTDEQRKNLARLLANVADSAA
jgi:ribosome recycling factor